MSDDKKSDDYRVDMPSGKEFSAPTPLPRTASARSAPSVTENPVAAILAYCGSSILMTVTNKYVLSGVDFNLNFFLLCVQVWSIPQFGVVFLTNSVCCLRCSNFDMQSRRHHHVPGLQQR